MTFPARLAHRLLLLLPALPIASPVYAQDGPVTTHKFTLGTYLSRGNYGASEDTDIQYFPLSYEFASFPWVLSLTVPHLALEGPGDVFLEAGNIGRGRGQAPEFIDNSGLGDVLATASYQLPALFNDRLFVDFTVQAKLPTADEERDLGTGETDIGVQLDLYASRGRNTYFSTLGYRQRGNTPLYDLQDSLFASTGLMRQYGDNTYLGLIYDYREKASSNAFESHELMPFISYNFNERWNGMIYTIAGFTDSSADQTLGFQVTYTLP